MVHGDGQNKVEKICPKSFKTHKGSTVVDVQYNSSSPQSLHSEIEWAETSALKERRRREENRNEEIGNENMDTNPIGKWGDKEPNEEKFRMLWDEEKKKEILTPI